MLTAELLHQAGTNLLEATPEQVADARARAEALCAEDRERVVALGGLHIVGTERHEARRIDNQLRGRAGRQGDPGSSRFYLSLEDDLMRRFASDRVQGLMEKVGFTDDMALESGIVSRTIEGAQTRVEGYNFDLRKHVVQYDDVINLQRETIYAERNHILRDPDLSGTVLSLVEAEIRQLVAEHAADDPSEWNRDGLKAQLAAMVPLTAAELEVVDTGRDPGAVADALVEAAETHYDHRRQELGDDAMAALNRIVLLRVIDSLWVEHLTAVDDMRRSIGLRAYSQRDPLNEFKVEAFRMFDELKAMIRRDVARTIFRVNVVRQPAAAPAQRMVESRPDLGGERRPAAVGAAAGAVAAGSGGQPVRAATKIGRNDPCYCGSGKKYKRCHGA
jgi:preprotein translocase subunit SecA